MHILNNLNKTQKKSKMLKIDIYRNIAQSPDVKELI